MATCEEQACLSHGALLAKSCQAAMELAKHNKEAQGLAFKYGKHLSLGHKVFITNTTNDGKIFSIWASNTLRFTV